MPQLHNELGINCSDCNNLITTVNATYNYRGGLTTRCKSCVKIKRDIKNNKISQVSYQLKTKYDLSFEDYNKKLQLQLNGCAICKQLCNSGKRLSVDHNHKTNTNRDLLCTRCNTALGLLDENEDILINMIEYLKRHQLKIA